MKDLLHNAETVCTAVGACSITIVVVAFAAAYISSVREKRWRRRHSRRPVVRRDSTLDLTGHEFPYAGGGFQHRSWN